MPDDQAAVHPFDISNLINLLGDCKQAKYIASYLDHLETKTVVVEPKYIDRDYLVDYQKFYSRSYEDKKRFTTRFHFFSMNFSESQLDTWLCEGSAKEIDSLKNAYIGYLIKKPITDKNGKPLLGRTLLKTYKKSENGINRTYILGSGKASLYGIDLEAQGVPFQAQDKGVSACATISLWTALHILNPLFRLQEKAPAEITEMSAEQISEARIFPQEGLTFSQMIKFIRTTGLDTEIISAIDKDVIVDAVRAYVHAGIPLIADLKLTKSVTHPDAVDYHAAVIVGYQTDGERNITELYVHDDQIGPYSRVKPLKTLGISSKLIKPDFRVWNNEWLEKYEKVEVEKLLVPIYYKIRLPWGTIYHLFKESYRKKEKKEKAKVYLYLATIQEYKRHLLKQNIMEKSDKLKISLPKIIWIIRVYDLNNQVKADYLFDGTDINASQIGKITYQ